MGLFSVVVYLETSSEALCIRDGLHIESNKFMYIKPNA